MSSTLLARFENQPSLVAPEMQGLFESCLVQAANQLERLEKATDKPQMIDDFWFSDDDWRSFLRPYVVREGILQIPVKGVLLHDFPYQFGGWATGYEYIWRAFERGQGDPDVRGVALICDSPGGMVAGCFDCVDKMHAYEDRKPIRAFAQESAYSAAYAIASVADEINVSRTGGVGSIGVVTAHMDVSAAMAKYGYKITFVHAGKHKVDGNPYEALPEDVKARIQARIDELYEVFVSSVARNRGMDESAVRATEALTFTATQAVSNGLADNIGSLDDAVAAFAADLSLDEEDDTMSGQKTESAVDQAAAIETARTEGFEAGKAEGTKAGASAEKDRINAIIGSDEGQKRPSAALAAALDTDMSAEQASKFLAKLPEEKSETPGGDKPQGKSQFEAAMENGKDPDLGDPGEGATVSRKDRAFALAGKGKPKAA
jgi:capsid assembly protease